MWFRIDRYLLKELLLTFVATLLVLLAVALSNRLALYLGKAASGLLAQDTIYLLLGLQGIRFLVLLTPLALLLSTMLTLGRLYRDNEIVAMMAGGMGPGAIYRPLFMLVLPLAMLIAVLSLHIVPLCMAVQAEVQDRARRDAQVSLFTPGTFREIADGEHVVYIGSLDQEGRGLRWIFVRSLRPDGIAVTTGERGYQEIDPKTDARYIVLQNGHRYEGAPGEGDFQSMRFERLAAQAGFAPPEQQKIKREAIPTRELLASHSTGNLAEFHQRLSAPLSLPLIAFVTPLLARANPREGRYGRVVLAVLVFTVYVNLLLVGISWLANGLVWPALGLWWAHGLFLLLGVVLWVRAYGLPWRRPESGVDGA
ncbi:MAG: LPS export ABC transporter permease LptF [Gammaproteobacteria bacterium]|nr:LPS export ABC transporter permease LptF [Gammaproteobacteria bacterium]MCP5425969.1 LPS export ABC transporter permease LptF [Gammaproteobacteria bacterium]MCP5458843.1 LPS export ABC transporter permease LptF [Gammaproteobacteria bacterium]